MQRRRGEIKVWRFRNPKEVKQGDVVLLSEEESHHLHTAVRVEVGEKVLLIDGKGSVAEALVRISHKKKSEVEVLAVKKFEKSSDIQIVFGISKSKANDFIMHRCTEVGVSGFQPLVTRHSAREERWNMERWNKVVWEVIKQCQDPYVPEINEPIALETWLNNRDKNRLLVFCDEGHRLVEQKEATKKEVDILIGPEGGWHSSEQDLILSHNAQLLGLGQNRLRTETAALAALVKMRS